MRKRSIVLVLIVLILLLAFVFVSYFFIRVCTKEYVQLAFIKTLSNITRKNKDLSEVFTDIRSNTLKMEALAETVNTNISIAGFTIKNVSLSTGLLWNNKYKFYAKNKVNFGIFNLARINIFGDENEVGISVPQIIDESVVFNMNKIYIKDDLWISEIVKEVGKIILNGDYTYIGKEKKSFARVSKDTYKIKIDLSKDNIGLLLQKIDIPKSVQNKYEAAGETTINLYTNKRYEITAIEIKNSDLEIDFSFALLGEKWLLSDFAFEGAAILEGKKIHMQATGSICLMGKDKIEITLEPIDITTDFIKPNTKVNARLNLLLSKSDTDNIYTPTNKFINYKDLQKDKLNEMFNKLSQAMQYLD